MRRRLLIPLAVLLATAACGSGSGSTKLIGDKPPTAYTLPTGTWTDQAGRPFTLSPGKVTLVYFGYTGCPDVCPTVMADQAAALRAMKPADAAKVQVVVITSDPKDDTPAAFTTWFSNFSFPSSVKPVGLSASWEQITAAGKALGVPLTDTEPQTVEEVGHGAQVVSFSADGTSHAEWLPSDHLAKDLTHDLPLLVAGKTA